jgi:hypothetical protein
MFHVKHFCPIDSLRKALSQGGAKYGSEILPVQNDRLVLGFGPIFCSSQFKIMTLRLVQKSRIMHREVAPLESATYRVQKLGANVGSPC